jgi:hypothetical protein
VLIRVYSFLLHKWAADAFELNVWASESYRVEVRERLYSELLVCLLFCISVKVVSYIKKQHRLRLIDNRVLRKVFGPRRAEVTEDWRKLRSEELQDLYSVRILVR